MKRIAATLVLAVAAVIAMPACDERDDKPGGGERQHEILQHRTSGFWTSNRPAEHGRYRWRLLALGAVLATATGFVLYRLLRRATTQRFAGAGAPAVLPPSRPPEPTEKPPAAPP